MKTIKLFAAKQPSGTMYIGKMSAKEISKHTKISQRKDSEEYFQRPDNKRRIEQIKKFCISGDAVFPSSVIILLDTLEDDLEESTPSKNQVSLAQVDQSDLYELRYHEDTVIGQIIDGQHRILGIDKSDIDDIELPVVFVIGDQTIGAYIFSVVNGTQQPVSSSHIYDLFDLIEGKSVTYICHLIVKVLNDSEHSPLFKKIKMLGMKTNDVQTITQGSFAKYIMKLITNETQSIGLKKTILKDDYNFPFREFYNNDQIDVMNKILLNYLSATKKTFPVEWEQQDSILTKTVGIGGLITALKPILVYALKKGNATEEFFLKITAKFKANLSSANLQLISNDFPSNSAGLTKFSKKILESFDEIVKEAEAKSSIQ